MISVIIPIYNGEEYLFKLVEAIRSQIVGQEIEIIAAVSKSNDRSFILAKELCDLAYSVEEFNHGLTRHEAAQKSNGEYLVFITQDILPFNNMWLNELIKPLIENSNIVATYSRQIAYPGASKTESYIREYNYPPYNRLCNSYTIEKWGRKNIFYSDAASATKREDFFGLGGYNFEVITNEDVYYALNVIDSGNSILYNANSIVYHSHDFSLKENIKRYESIGAFETTISSRLEKYSSNGEGLKLVRDVSWKLLRDFNVKELMIFLLLDVPSRLFAYNKGKKSFLRRFN
ncbi:glycosyl transferase [Bacillus sp. AFS073361]|uniref:glycosyltransferase n=1 Tax=Bacillus sp. AFS073361 TaxID=2033511 RepID=UPI000BF36FD8|nr:glycosyltransferase [Bacillus sp. AFS073361]PFP30856.1 glycosyl transferase [Bacillus sp. AFS073361]